MKNSADDIIKLFRANFRADNYLKMGKADKFTCPFKSKCNVDVNKEPIWSAALGDDGTEVMIVAEAPSKTGGAGPHIGGRFADWPRDNKSRYDSLRDFVREYYQTTPYFTDLIKCGVAKQTRENKASVFGIRMPNCIERFLIKEIEIVNPKIILCIGKRSYDSLKEIKKRKQINVSIKLIPLIHYSNQAGLPLSIADKQNLIWPYQLGKISIEKLSELSCFKK